ncbi:TetR family transcriptional regulator [Sphingopyxis panaciterrulae]|uniref:AcrR family transcriptional regulator n=1 Tax=Sphingopyxis panaciterrulae TaxID=462372 RepID=A0A7W9B6V4_9SPHN|nr:AcrR family transcriptional regulator [Sphingopyxis panaciterrulae]
MPRFIAEKADIIPVLADVFREHGYEGATLSRIHERTGLGRGSLYHFFPGGKEEMAASVLTDIDAWFAQYVFEPLRREDGTGKSIDQMLDAVTRYFGSGNRICLVGAFALTDARDRFGTAVAQYFTRWIDALSAALRRMGASGSIAIAVSEDIVTAIQGAIVVSRSLDDPAVFERTMSRLRAKFPLVAHDDALTSSERTAI